MYIAVNNIQGENFILPNKEQNERTSGSKDYQVIIIVIYSIVVF